MVAGLRMFERLGNWIRRRAGRPRIAIVTPVGPGHAALYAECRASAEAAWQFGHGPFSALSFFAVDDGEGRLGRSRARNLGIERAMQEGADWLFFLDADDLMVEGAFEAVTPFVGDHDAVWGLILGLSPGASQPHLRIPQIVGMNALEDLLMFDPFLTLQMGHFVRTPVAAAAKFNESMDAGEDFDYYLRVWSQHRCAKVAREFFINRHARHSTGPRAASAADWGSAVRGRQRAECEQRAIGADAAAVRERRNARAVELQSFCRQHALVSARDSIALSAQMPYFGSVEVNEYDGGSFVLQTENDDAICARLMWTGEYQPFTAALWQAIAAGGGSILDVGAGNGLYALLAARVAPRARIVCFDPFAGNLARARTNLQRNAIANVELIERAAADFDGPGQLQLQTPAAMLPLAGEFGPTPGRPIECLRLDDYLARSGIGAVTLARINAGSSTAGALRGMAQTLGRQQPDLIVDLQDGTVAGAIDEILRPHDYCCYAVDDAARELSALSGTQLTSLQGPLQLLASARPLTQIRRMAGDAMGRLRGD